VLVLVFPSIAMWFPNWLQERRNAERSVQMERPAPGSALLGAGNVGIAR
jgi:hypothetical protein